MIPTAAFGIYKLLKKRSLDVLEVDELKAMEIKLNNKIENLNQETKEIDAAINRMFEKARHTSTKTEEINVANRIKTLNQKKEMKQSAIMQLEKEVRAVDNLLILKENEGDLKEAGVWEQLDKLEPEKIEDWLTSKTLERRNRQELMNDVISLTSEAMEKTEYDEDLEDILKVIREVKKGKTEVYAARKKLTEEKS